MNEDGRIGLTFVDGERGGGVGEGFYLFRREKVSIESVSVAAIKVIEDGLLRVDGD